MLLVCSFIVLPVLSNRFFEKINFTEMAKWKLNFVLLIAISSALLVNVFAEDVQDDEDDDGVTIEAEKIVNSSP